MHNAQFKNIIILFISVIRNLLSIIYYLRRVEDELDPPERPPLLLPPLKPPEERVDEDDGRYVEVERVVDDELLTLEEEFLPSDDVLFEVS